MSTIESRIKYVSSRINFGDTKQGSKKTVPGTCMPRTGVLTDHQKAKLKWIRAQRDKKKPPKKNGGGAAKQSMSKRNLSALAAEVAELMKGEATAVEELEEPDPQTNADQGRRNHSVLERQRTAANAKRARFAADGS